MRIRRFYTFLPSVEDGSKRIGELISDVKKAKKEVKWYYCCTNVKINLIGLLNTRIINLERVSSMSVKNDMLKISFSAITRDKNHELKDKDAAITIPIKMVDSIEVDVVH